MSRYDFAFILCRLVAVSIATLLILSLPIFVPLLSGPDGGYRSRSEWLLTLSIPGLCLVLAAVFWLLAPVIAMRMLPPRRDTASDLPIDRDALMSVVFVGIGLWNLIDGALSIPFYLLFLIRTGNAVTPDATLILSIAQCLIGLCLIVRTRGLVGLVNRLQGGERSRTADGTGSNRGDEATNRTDTRP